MQHVLYNMTIEMIKHFTVRRRRQMYNDKHGELNDIIMQSRCLQITR